MTITFKEIADELAQTLTLKNEAYGSAFDKSEDFLKLLYPNGITPEQYADMLCIVRIFDKLMRIANKKDAFAESPYADLAGYALLGEKKTRETQEAKKEACMPIFTMSGSLLSEQK
jgi:hypothetical protein